MGTTQELWAASLQSAFQPYNDEEWWYPLGLGVSTAGQEEEAANKPNSSSEQGANKDSSSSEHEKKKKKKKKEGSIFAVQCCYLTTATGEGG